jgi:hypothetical protein
MTESELVTAAESHRHALTQPLDMEHTVLVWDRSTTAAPARSIGTITLRDGAVSRVVKYWTIDEAVDGPALARAVFSALSQLPAPVRESCGVRTESLSDPGQSEERTSFVCGNRSVWMSLIRNDRFGITRASVYESLR